MLIKLMTWLIGGLILLAVFDACQWSKFKADHHCTIVSKENGETFSSIGIGANGQMTVAVGSTADKTAWKCDDGITYYK